MVQEVKSTYPTFPATHWSALRSKFRSAGMPRVVTADYLEAAIRTTHRAATDLVSSLKALGLIDGDAKPTERAEKWRHDETYAEVCTEIRMAVYPEELMIAIPDPAQERSAAELWFARKAKAGEKWAKKMAALYELLMEADPAPKPTARQKNRKEANKGLSPVRVKPNDQRNAVSLVKSSDSANNAADIEASAGKATGTVSQITLHIEIHVHLEAGQEEQQMDRLLNMITERAQRIS
jgi:hypothetical protein